MGDNPGGHIGRCLTFPEIEMVKKKKNMYHSDEDDFGLLLSGDIRLYMGRIYVRSRTAVAAVITFLPHTQ